MQDRSLSMSIARMKILLQRDHSEIEWKRAICDVLERISDGINHPPMLVSAPDTITIKDILKKLDDCPPRMVPRETIGEIKIDEYCTKSQDKQYRICGCVKCDKIVEELIP